MIPNWFFHLLATSIDSVAALLPSADFPSVDWGAIQGPLGQVDYLVPIYPVFAVVLTMLLMGPAFLAASVGMYFIAFIRGASPRL
ncbi:MAG: hypothetical protein ACJ71Y_14120 [Blastococcus sp.]